jgi:hypothetical protein
MATIYEARDKNIASSEGKRMANYSYPNEQVTMPLLKPLVRGSSVLDAGAGPSTVLGNWVAKNGGSYTALDIQEDWIRAHREAGHRTVLGSLLEHPIVYGLFDITHTRFVLMHLPEEKRAGVVRGLLEASRKYAAFIEYDWHTLGGTETVELFKAAAVALMQHRGIEPYMGFHLPKLLRKQLPAGSSMRCSDCFSGQLGDYTDLIGLAESFQRIAEAEDVPGIGELMLTLKAAFEREAASSQPEVFTRMKITTVFVTHQTQGEA